MTKECYQKPFDVQESLRELPGVGGDEYVFILRKQKEEDLIDCEDDDQTQSQSLLDMWTNLQRELDACLRIMLVEKGMKDGFSIIFKQLKNIQEKKYLFVMTGYIF